METHDERTADRTDAKWVDLRVDQVLDRVPTHSPAKSTKIDAYNRHRRSMLLACGELEALLFKTRDSGKEGGDVGHGECLETDTDAQTSLTANNINQEEGAHDGSNELDNTEDGRGKELLILSLGSEKSKEIGGVDGNAAGTTPLGEELNTKTKVQSVCILWDQEHLLECSHES